MIKPMIYEECATLVKPKSIQKLIVNKTYEMRNNMISESCFDVSDKQGAIDFIKDYCRNLNNKLILVINSNINMNEVAYFLKGIQNCFKLVINYNCTIYSSDILYFEKIQTINIFSIKNAVSFAYKHLENDHAILFAYVDSDFDLFEHLDLD